MLYLNSIRLLLLGSLSLKDLNLDVLLIQYFTLCYIGFKKEQIHTPKHIINYAFIWIFTITKENYWIQTSVIRRKNNYKCTFAAFECTFFIRTLQSQKCKWYWRIVKKLVLSQQSTKEFPIRNMYLLMKSHIKFYIFFYLFLFIYI